MAGSSALRQFKSNLQAATQLTRIERKGYHDPPHPDETSGVQGLRGGAAVLMVAAFEEFLKSLSREVLGTISIEDVDFARLPPPMQVHSVYSTLSLAMSGTRHGEATERFDRLSDIAAACSLVLAQRVNPEAFTETYGNPGSKTVKEIFKDVGLPNIFAEAQGTFDTQWNRPTHATYLVDKLDEIVGRRHVVAHTADALHISRADLREALRFLRILSDSMDRVLRRHVRQLRRTARI